MGLPWSWFCEEGCSTHSLIGWTLGVPGENSFSPHPVSLAALWNSKLAFSFLCSFSKELCLQHGSPSWRNYDFWGFSFSLEGIRSQNSSNLLRSYSSAPAASILGWVHFVHVALLGQKQVLTLNHFECYSATARTLDGASHLVCSIILALSESSLSSLSNSSYCRNRHL